MACNCIENIDQMLKERQDGRLEISIVFPRPAPGQKSPPAYTVPNLRILRRDTGKAETRSKFFRAMSPTFCPFCGTCYETREEPAVADTKRVILSGHVRTDAVGSECEFEETFSVPASLAGAALDEHLAGEARELALERVEWSYAVKNAEEKTDET